MEQTSQERDRGHRTAESDSWSCSGGDGEWAGCCAVESGVAESVEGADEVGEGWEAHVEICCKRMVLEGRKIEATRWVWVCLLHFAVAATLSCSWIRHRSTATMIKSHLIVMKRCVL